MTTKIAVLDHGYVRLVDHLGSDLTTVNSARVSFDKQVNELSPKDTGLIRFLAEEGHTSPFRHGMLQFEVHAPLMIARQWWKYVVGSDHTMDAWNESSRRYVTEEPVFYTPEYNEWRQASKDKKQGSDGFIDETEGGIFSMELLKLQEQCMNLYDLAMSRGVTPEMARLFLPAYGMYVRWYWTASLQSVAHLINQRTKVDAQHEFQEYAEAVKLLAETIFPTSLREMVK